MYQGELESLAADIKQNGLHNPIVIAGNQILDGRNRLKACEIAGVTPTFTEWNNGHDILGWIISQNLHRRHLNDDQRAMIAARLREGLKKELQKVRANKAAHTRWKSLPPTPGDKHGDSRVQAAKMLNVSRSKVGQAIKILPNKDLAEKVASGQTTLKQAKRTILQQEREAQIVEAHRDLKTECRIEHCEFQKLLPTLHDVDLLVIDPPYAKTYLPLFDSLGNLAAKALAPQGTLAVMVGQSYLPEYYASLSKHLDYRWTLCYLMPQCSAPMIWQRKANPFWKPVLIYQRKGSKPEEWIKKDIITAGELEKDLHPWEQDVDGFKQIIEMLSDPGDLVADCFLGSGTTALAAMEAQGGRRFIGCDVDLEAVNVARKRVGQTPVNAPSTPLSIVNTQSLCATKQTGLN